MRRRFMKMGSKGIPANQFWYYVTDDAILDDIKLKQAPFNSQVVKHEKQNNKCIITCVDNIRIINNVWAGGREYIVSIVIPDSVTEIGHSAFTGCPNITSIVIPDGVTTIGTSALYDCDNLTSVTIGKGVTYIGNHALFYCFNLKDVYCKPIIPPELDGTVFSKNVENRKIYVPRNSVEDYKKEWSTYANEIEPYDF